MENIVTEIRKYIACPQFGDIEYGEWGALRFDQRYKIKKLCDYTKSLEYIVERKDIMSKEEYAEMCYLLGKLKYCFAEASLKDLPIRKQFEEIVKNINEIMNAMVPVDNKENEKD